MNIMDQRNGLELSTMESRKTSMNGKGYDHVITFERSHNKCLANKCIVAGGTVMLLMITVFLVGFIVWDKTRERTTYQRNLDSDKLCQMPKYNNSSVTASSLSPNYTYGDTVNFTCRRGYKPQNGAAVITCLKTGRWSDSPLKCTCVNQCADGQCIEFEVTPADVWCDGRKHCQDGSDEPRNCACREDQFRCNTAGVCVPSKSECNGIVECLDHSDETSCECKNDEFQCGSGICIAKHRACDGFTDCPFDMADETNCECKQNQFRCRNGKCIAASRTCDGFDDCQDDSDERYANCSCHAHQYTCYSGECIHEDLVCDGDLDCSDGSDEKNCASCKASEFQCKNYECIPRVQRCNGIHDCKDTSDENGCARMSATSADGYAAVEVLSADTWLPVCSENWTHALAGHLCLLTGNSGLASTKTKTGNSSTFAVRSHVKTNNTIIGLFVRTSSCINKKIVMIKCEKKVCGKRPSSLTIPSEYVIGGNLATAGNWPWMVAIHVTSAKGKNPGVLCGGVLIDARWVLTAAHCSIRMEGALIQSSSVKFFVRVGGTRIDKNGAPYKLIPIEKIVSHPGYWSLNGNTTVGSFNDIGLLKLAHAVTFDDNIAPICLPEQDEKHHLSSICYITGWGYTGLRDPQPTTNVSDPLVSVPLQLREGRARLLSNDTCSTIYKAYDDRIMVCAGFTTGRPISCFGDSGGPLSCLGKNKVWSLAGIVSFSKRGCQDVPTVNTRVSAYADWIFANTGNTEN